jgi:hypothetical protein
MPYPAGSYNDENMPLMHDIPTGGIDLRNRKPPRFYESRASFLRRRAII